MLTIIGAFSHIWVFLRFKPKTWLAMTHLDQSMGFSTDTRYRQKLGIEPHEMHTGGVLQKRMDPFHLQPQNWMIGKPKRFPNGSGKNLTRWNGPMWLEGSVLFGCKWIFKNHTQSFTQKEKKGTTYNPLRAKRLRRSLSWTQEIESSWLVKHHF